MLSQRTVFAGEPIERIHTHDVGINHAPENGKDDRCQSWEIGPEKIVSMGITLQVFMVWSSFTKTLRCRGAV